MIRTAPLSILALTAATGAAQPVFEDYKLCESDGSSSDYFGRCVEIGDDLIMVGISRDDETEVDGGSVFLYRRATGAAINKLFPDDAQPGDLFGAAVAYHGGVIAVGSVRDDDNAEDSGSVYLFDTSTGAQIKKIHASDPSEEDYFGGPLAMDGGLLIVGVRCDDDNGADSGSIYLFDVPTAQQIMKLTADDGQPADWFGTSVAIDAGVIAVGAVFDDQPGADDAGSVYLFDAKTGQQLGKITAADAESDDRFGNGVALSDGVLAVHAPGDEHPGRSDTGSVYLYDTANGDRIGKIVPPTTGHRVRFNAGIDLRQGFLAIGASTEQPDQPHGRVTYLYRLGGAEPPVLHFPSEGIDHDDFGYQIALGEHELLVGAPAFFGGSPGAVYRYALPGSDEPCAPDLNADGSLDFFDISLFLSGRPDFNNDGTFDFFDVTDFVAAFTAGCP